MCLHQTLALLRISQQPNMNPTVLILFFSLHLFTRPPAWQHGRYKMFIKNDLLRIGKRLVFESLMRYGQSSNFFFVCSHHMKYLIPIVGLFQGRIIDKPEQAMASTTYS